MHAERTRRTDVEQLFGQEISFASGFEVEVVGGGSWTVLAYSYF
jgi:hypothetical protein